MKRIFIVDDNPQLREMLRKQLVSLGYEVCGEARDGETAIALIGSCDPDLILMDIDLGGGIDGISAVLKLEHLSRAAIVFVSGQSSWDTISSAMETKPFGFLLKPYHLRELYLAIEVAIVRRDADIKLRDRDRQLTFIESIGHIGIWRFDERRQTIHLSASASALMGLPHDDRDIAFQSLLEKIESNERGRLAVWLKEDSVGKIRIKALREDGQTRILLFHRDTGAFEPGSDNVVSGVVQDITDAEEIAEKMRAAEDRYRAVLDRAGDVQDVGESFKIVEEAQKLERSEVIGQLTGGMAHDFNNILAVIQGNVELISEYTSGHREELSAIQRATARGAELTSWLLSYSRRQTLHPKPVNLVTMIDNSVNILNRAIREDIEIAIEHSPHLPIVSVDGGQFETALLNLAINARDAMEFAGELTIATGIEMVDAGKRAEALELNPGRYGYVSVSDTGSGIDATILPKVLDPFFTTKEVGKGVGLGLSMVYGFCKQSGGGLEIVSKVNVGTTVRLLFPLTDDAAAVEKKVEKSDTIPRGTGQKVFLIEDDPDVCSFLVKMIEGLGYRISFAENGDAALKKSADWLTADVVVSDVVLPGTLNGPALVERIRNKNPKIRTILISGYPRIFPETGTLPGNADSFMSKPFSRRKLADVLRDVLMSEPKDAVVD